MATSTYHVSSTRPEPGSGGRTHPFAGEGVGRGSKFGRGVRHCGTLGIYVLCDDNFAIAKTTIIVDVYFLKKLTFTRFEG